MTIEKIGVIKHQATVYKAGKNFTFIGGWMRYEVAQHINRQRTKERIVFELKILEDGDSYTAEVTPI